MDRGWLRSGEEPHFNAFQKADAQPTQRTSAVLAGIRLAIKKTGRRLKLKGRGLRVPVAVGYGELILRATAEFFSFAQFAQRRWLLMNANIDR